MPSADAAGVRVKAQGDADAAGVRVKAQGDADAAQQKQTDIYGINPEAARFYDGLGDTKMTGNAHDAVGDIYMQYLDAPERVVSNSEFAPLERAYRIYEASPTIEHASAFLDEAGKVQRIANRNGYALDNPFVMMNAAMQADAALRQNAQGDGAATAGDMGAAAIGNAADAGKHTEDTKMDGDRNGGYNGGNGSSNKAGNFKEVNGLDDFISRIPANAEELPWRNIEGGAKEGVRYRWTDAEGNVWDVRAHSVDPKAPTGSNANKGWIYRVEVRWGGRGKKYYMDSSGNFHPYNVTNPNSPMYDEVIANDTHIILDRKK